MSQSQQNPPTEPPEDPSCPAPTESTPAAADPSLFPIKEDRILSAIRVYIAQATEAPEVQGNDQAEFAVTREAVKEALKRLNHAAATIAKKYDSFLRRTGPAISTRKYISKDRQIQANLTSRRNQHFFQIIEYLYANCLGLNASKGLSINKKGAIPAICKPDIAAIASMIDKSVSHVRKYLQGMEQAGFIQRMPDSVKHTTTGAYYVLGEWGKVWFNAKGEQQRPKVSWFIQDKPEIIQKLRTWSRPD